MSLKLISALIVGIFVIISNLGVAAPITLNYSHLDILRVALGVESSEYDWVIYPILFIIFCIIIIILIKSKRNRAKN